MKSLSDLNSFANTSVTVTDSRPSRVIFDLVSPLEPQDLVLNILSTTQTVVPTINIEDIWNYYAAGVTYQITIIPGDITPLSGSSLTFNSLPGHMDFTQIGNVYTLTGFQTKEDWQEIKTFTWNLPANYATCPLWYLELTITYYDSELGTEVIKDWRVYDDQYYYTALLESQVELTIDYDSIKRTTVALTVTTGFECFIAFESDLLSSFSLSTTAQKLKRITANLTSNAQLSAFINIQGQTQIQFTANCQLTSAADRIDFITGLQTSQTYYSNRANSICSSIVVNPNVSDTIKVELIPSSGYITDKGTQGFTRYVQEQNTTAASWNTYFDNLDYCAPYSETSSKTISIKIYYAGNLRTNTTISLTHNTTGQINTTFNQYTSATTSSFNIYYEQFLYGKLDYYVIGGGGAGGHNSLDRAGGGGSGDITTGTFVLGTNLKQTFLDISGGSAYYYLNSINYTVGQAGALNSVNQNGGSGQTSSLSYTNQSNTAITYSVIGGEGGYSGAAGANGRGGNYADGGDSGSYPSQRTGGVGWDGTSKAGGGGGGAQGNGSNATLSAGQYYGGQGGSGYTLPSGFSQSQIGRGGNGGGASGSGTQDDNAGSGGNSNTAGRAGGVFVKISAR